MLGGFHTPADGLAMAVRAVEAQAARATARGARFLGGQEVAEVINENGRVTGVRTVAGDVFDADVVVSAVGFWGAQLGASVGLTVPLVPMAHQYAKTGQVPGLVADETGEGARLPILRHQDEDLYYREHGDRIGIGYYGHRPMPIEMDTLLQDTADEAMPSMLPFTDDDFAPAWAASTALLPVLGDAKVEEGFNGIFSFTPDGFSIMGEHRELSGFWVAEAVWVTHSAGVAKAMAEWIVDGAPGTDVHECDLYRFEKAALSPAFVRRTSSQAFVEVYDILHPHQYRDEPRNVRISPFNQRERELGAFFFEGGCWERPAWYEANAPLLETLREQGLDVPERDDWSARFYSPISIAEARWTREHVAFYDMTPLTPLRGRRARCRRLPPTSDLQQRRQERRVGHLHAAARREWRRPKRSHGRPAGTRPLPGRRQRPAGLRLVQPAAARRWQRLGARRHRWDVLRRRLGPEGTRPGAAAVPRRPVPRGVQVLPRAADPHRFRPGDDDAGVLRR